MDHTQQRNKLRALLAGSKCLSPASVYDPLSARIAESVGYEFGLLSGSLVAATTLAAPDLAVHTLTEYADQIRRIMRVSALSLYVDADTGFGSALNVMRTVHEFEHAGVSGLSIEDTVAPMSFGQGEKEQRLVSIEEGVGKMRAAVAARSDPSLVIAARTPAIKIEGIASALVRARAYAAAGVDVIFLPAHSAQAQADVSAGAAKLEHLEAIHAATRLPIIVGAGYGLFNQREKLAALGARILLQGHQVVPAVVKALRDTYMHLFNGGAPADLEFRIASVQELEQLVNSAGHRLWLRDYLH